MHTTSYAMSDGSEDASATPVLIAPAEVMAVVDALNLELGAWQNVSELPASGLVVCLPGVPYSPPGWAGVWARSEIPPAGTLGPTPRGRGY